MKKHCGCRSGLGGRLGTSKYGISTADKAAWSRACRVMALPGFKPAKHQAHVHAYAAWNRSQPKLKAAKATDAHDAHVSMWKQACSGAWYAHRYRTDAEFNAKEKLRTQLRKLRHADSDVARLMSNNIKRGLWLSSWVDLLGYSMGDLVAHLKRTLPKRATWEQFLDGDLHIDHIVPRASFDMDDPSELRACWSLGNLRLIHKRDNLAKSNRRTHLL